MLVSHNTMGIDSCLRRNDEEIQHKKAPLFADSIFYTVRLKGSISTVFQFSLYLNQIKCIIYSFADALRS